MYVIYEKPFEEILTDVSSVAKEFSEESLRKLFVFQWLAVIAVPEVEIARFLSSGSKYLQNSSRKQKISIIFAAVIGVWIDCNLLFGSYKIQNNSHSYNFSSIFLIPNSRIK